MGAVSVSVASVVQVAACVAPRARDASAALSPFLTRACVAYAGVRGAVLTPSASSMGDARVTGDGACALAMVLVWAVRRWTGGQVDRWAMAGSLFWTFLHVRADV